MSQDRDGPPPLLQGDCQVWWARPVADTGLLHLLDDRERARHSSLLREADRARYLSAHALTRLVVGTHLGVHPRALRFDVRCKSCGGPHGKPHLLDQRDELELSLSHSGQRVAVAVTRGIPVGVDVEQLPHHSEDEPPAGEFLSTEEQRALQQLPTPSRLEALMIYWTRKEALLKVTGDGLALAPSSVTVSAPGDPPRLLAWSAARPLPRPVCLYDLAPGKGHVGSLAVMSTPSARAPRLSLRANALRVAALSGDHGQLPRGSLPTACGFTDMAAKE